jgi:hypothetical protein
VRKCWCTQYASTPISFWSCIRNFPQCGCNSQLNAVPETFVSNQKMTPGKNPKALMQQLQVSLWQNNGYFAWGRFSIYKNISLVYCWNGKCFRQNSTAKPKHAFFSQYIYIFLFFFFFFCENRAVYEILWKNILELDRPQITICTGHALCMLDN